MSHRRGVTLIEVLVAIFIMGIGLLALLTLFPLGALSMARAVRDHDVATFGSAMAGLADGVDLRNDTNVGTYAQQSPSNPFPAPDPDGPGYPVLSDPCSSPYSNNVGSNLTSPSPTPGLWRVSPSAFGTATTAAMQNLFTFLDDPTFDTNGLPLNTTATTTTGTVDRPGRLTACCLMRRPKSAVPDLTEMSVIIYSSRDNTTFNAEPSYPVSGTVAAGATSVTINYASGATGGKPNILADNWILDTTYETRTDPGTGQSYGWVHGYLYQVSNVTDNNDGTLTLELQSPIRPAGTNATTAIANVTWLQNAVYVLEKGAAPRKR